MPSGLTFEQAAAVPMAGVTALVAVRDDGRLQRGQTVLINGASGGVGTFAVQIARALGGKVTASCSRAPSSWSGLSAQMRSSTTPSMIRSTRGAPMTSS